MKNPINSNRLFVTIGVIAVCLIIGCETAYYKTMESIGYHKRDILVNRVQDARGAQEEAKEQFQSALEKFGSVLNYSGGELQNNYETQLISGAGMIQGKYSCNPAALRAT